MGRRAALGLFVLAACGSYGSGAPAPGPSTSSSGDGGSPPICSESVIYVSAKGDDGNQSRITGNCTGEDGASCFVDADCAAGSDQGTACLRSVFASVTDPSFGRTEVLSADGLRLKQLVTCKIAQGGIALPEITADLYGLPRSVPIAMGAHEYDGPCSN